MKNRRLKAFYLFLALVLLAPATGVVSCKAPGKLGADENRTYTVKIDSNSVGVEFGPIQFDIGNAYMSQAKYSEAITAYSASLNNGYKNIEVYIKRSAAYLALGFYSGAIADASIVLDTNSSEIRAYKLRGEAYLSSGDYRKAVDDFSQAIKLAPSSKENYVDRARAMISLTRYGNALDDLDAAIKIDPSYSSAYFWRALIYESNTRDYDAALKDYTRAIEMKGGEVFDAYNNRGMVYFKLNEYDEAIADFSTLLELDPGYWLAYYNRGMCYAAIKQYRNAVNDFDTYLKLDANNKYGAVSSADYLAGYYEPFLEGYIH